MKTWRKPNGITIVSLVVTIILLLILASISIQALTNTGLFESAHKAKLETKRGQIKEYLGLELINAQSENYTGSAEKIIRAMQEKLSSEEGINGIKNCANDVKSITVDEVSNEEDMEKVDWYFYVTVDKDVYKVDLSGADFIGEQGKFLPVIKLESISNTTNTIIVKVKTSRNQGGKLEYYIKTENEEEYTLKETKTDDSAYVFENLEQNKKYNIKVIAKAENGQQAELTAEQTTGSVTGLTTANTTFSYSPAQGTWTKGSVTATVSTTVTGYTLQTSKDGKTWTSTASQTFMTNGTVYARLWDGTNGGTALSGNVTNIDTLAPKEFTPTAESTTRSITVNASVEDAEKTSTSGKSGISGYRFKLDSEEWTEYQTSGTYTWNNLAQTTDHTITVEAKDNAGNTKTGTVSKGTGTVTTLTTANTTFSYSPAQGTWTNGSVTATVSTTVTGYTLQTSKDGKTWTSTSSQTFTANGTIYVRLWDGTNGGGAATGNVTNIDTLAPKEFTPTAESTTKSITVNANAEDAEKTSTSGKSGISGYRFKLDGGEWTNYQASGTYTWDNLTQTTSHTITVEAKDNAGNTKTGTVSKGTGTVTTLTTANTTFSYSPAQGTWTNGSVTATVSTTVTGYTLQTSKDGKAWSSTASQTFTANGTVYARLWDGTNGGTATSGNVTNIDTTAPTISTALKSTSTGINSVSLSVGITDTNSGLGKVEWYYGTTNNPTTLAGTTSVTTLNGTTKGPTTAQTKTYTISNLKSATAYYFKVIAYDVAGKTVTSSVISAKTNNPTAADVSYTPSDTSWKVENVKQALDALYSR